MTTNPTPKRALPGQLPTLALGAMNFGQRTPADESERIVRRALERGITVFDTANSYYAGESERILGRALGRDRERVVLTSKVGIGADMSKREGLSPEVMRGALAGSLERLGTDRLDVYYLHFPDRTTPIDRTLDAMKELIASGRVRHWGVSNYASWEILEMVGLGDARGLARPSLAQMIYSVLHRQLEVEYFGFARRYGLHTSIYNPLAGGLLTGSHRFEEAPVKGSRFDHNRMYRGRYWTRTMFARVEQLRPLAAREGLSLVDFAYAWVAGRPDVDSILVGPATVAQLDQAFDAIARPLSPATLAEADALAAEWSGTDTNYVR
ncbi:MAG TPA: aldo/keto reductase [Polyangiaceae bacterium]|nr:aldo/keto reductase [Polyangiaceae bacterium]